MSAGSAAMPIGWIFFAGQSRTGPPEDPETQVTSRRGCAIYSAESLYEAHLVLDLLGEANIEARLFNEHLIGAMGELPFIESYPKIWLMDESDRNAARRVIDVYEARRKQAIDGTRQCQDCGEESPENFELCWSCREPFDPE